MRYFLIALLVVFASCKITTDKKPVPADPVTAAITSLKDTAIQGDLIVRLGDDFMSNQIKNMNETHRDYSHAGLIIIKNNEKYVAEIAPAPAGQDIIRYTPIDSFLNPKYNVTTALYRYNLLPQQRAALADTIKNYALRNIRFDSVYSIHNDKLYCSEMIAKALEAATADKIKIKLSKAPKHMIKLLVKFFEPVGLSKEDIIKRDMIAIDNLYLRNDCKLLMRIKLKTFPGEENKPVITYNN